MKLTQRYKYTTISDFYCTQCGHKGLPIPRRAGQQREAGHLKRLYCMNCGRKTNHAEVRGFGAYTREDFELEYELGRFVDGKRVPVAELIGCNKSECEYNVHGKCWNANHSFECGHRPADAEEVVQDGKE